MSGLDLTKFMITLFIMFGLWNASCAFLGIFFSYPWLQVFEGLSAAIIGFTVGLLMGYIKVEDLKDFRP